MNSAKGLFAVITDLRSIRSLTTHEVRAEGVDAEALLVAWLNELIYIFDTERLLMRHFDIRSLQRGVLHATVSGEPVAVGRHEVRTAVKAATYHGLRVTHRDGLYRARITLDV